MSLPYEAGEYLALLLQGKIEVKEALKIKKEKAVQAGKVLVPISSII